MRTASLLILKVLALTIVLFVCFVVAGIIAGPRGNPQTPDQAAATTAPLLVVCLLTTIVMTHIIVRSRWAGWRLMATVFFVFYGVMTVMSQIESAVFITRLPPGVLPRLFLMGALIAAPFSVLAVLILGKRRSGIATTENARLIMPGSEWTWKLAVIALAYLILYFTFGYFVAWQNPAVREYYGSGDAGGFLAHLGTVVRETPWLIPIQILRAMLWALLALPVIRMMKGECKETAVAIGLLFAVITAQLLLPNPYMPKTVRLTHLIETAPSNFIFGFFVGWLLSGAHSFASRSHVRTASRAR